MLNQQDINLINSTNNVIKMTTDNLSNKIYINQILVDYIDNLNEIILKKNCNVILLKDCIQITLKLLAPYNYQLAKKIWNKHFKENLLKLNWPNCIDSKYYQ